MPDVDLDINEELTIAEIQENLGNWEWRINNLYRISIKPPEKDEDAEEDDEPAVLEMTFKMNWAQEALFHGMWNRNVILKARQLGMTTFIMIFMLDQILFNDNIHCGVITQGLNESSSLFNGKILYAYDRLPEWLKRLKKPIKRTGSHLEFENGSYITVGTSMRSGTLHYLHISEFGKICAKYPEKAVEIVTGSFPAVPTNGVIFIESTAEGQAGYFYEYSTKARNKQLAMKKLTRKEYKFFFFPWWEQAEYRLNDSEVDDTPIPTRLVEYFYELEEEMGIELTPNQKAWYVATEEEQGSKMKREFPSTADEAFEQSVEGAYFSKEFADIYSSNRITSVPCQPGVPVDTWWDLGMGDSMVIWLTQTIGGWIHVIDYYENSGEGMKHYIKVLQDRGYLFGQHYGPHDLEVRELMGDGSSRVAKAKKWGFNFNVVPRVPDKQDAIDAARDALPICIFDEEKCDQGIKKLERYKKKWNIKLGRWEDKPLHDDASDTADGFMTMAMGHPMFSRVNGRARSVRKVKSGRTA
ncbi:hypothetical protein A9Q81_11705 [Gammaproteobacteria bacterium 42_54_T18]|nr:hypothetical protein A9Q81_11705 [Gammaproteobacteria bacterium 42_54_T18]